MKKNVFMLALLVMGLVSCKKESVLPSSTTGSMETQLAELIQKGDPETYNAAYTNQTNYRAPKPTIKFIPGVFVILQGDVASGTCFPHQCVCFTIITWPAFIGDTSPVPTELVLPYSQSFPRLGEAELILNTSPTPTTIPNLNSVYVRNENGVPTISYTIK